MCQEKLQTNIAGGVEQHPAAPIPPIRFAAIVPALNEADSLGVLLAQTELGRLEEIIVVDNGSSDATAAVALAGGAHVVHEPSRGYGRACQAGIAALPDRADAVVFMDADLSDDPADLERLLDFFAGGAWDMVIGSRLLGHSDPCSLTPVQYFGNWFATKLIGWIWKVRYTDLGPLRVIRRSALERMALCDQDFGWNVEMQAKAAMLRLRVAEIPVSYRRRRFGQSKISGTLTGSVQAGFKILITIGRCWLNGRRADSP
ncbi:MAG: glycosyltransferase family 2 protein [Terriglobia bacterium]